MFTSKQHLRGKCDEKLLQIQFGILRERNLYPQRRLKIVHIHIERGQRHIVLDAELVLRLREAIPKTGAIHIAEHGLLRSAGRPNGDVHFGRHTARDGKVCVNVRLDGRIAEIDLREMPILLLRQIERKLIVDGQIVVARSLARIAVIVIGGVALFAMVARQPFGAAIALCRFVVAVRRLAVALALLTDATVDRAAPVAGFAALTIGAGRQILARLDTGVMIGARAVAVALAAGTVRKMPPIGGALHFILGATITAGQALAEPRLGAVVAPTACGVVAALRARPDKMKIIRQL